MSNKAIAVPRLDDQVALKLARALDATHSANGFHIDIAGLDAFNLKDNVDDQKKRIIQRIDRAGSYLIHSISLSFEGFNITYLRGDDPNRKNVFIDTITINSHNQQPSISADQKLDLLDTLNKFLWDRGVVPGESGAGDESVSALEMTYRSTVLKLETSFADQIQKISSWTVDQADAYEKRKLELAEETNVERVLLRTAFDQQQEKLKDDRLELDELRKRLDDRDYMHARRAIRGELQQIVKAREEKFSLTNSTRKLRQPVHFAMLLLLAFLLALNGVFLEQLTRFDIANASGGLLAWVFAKQGLAAVAFIGSIFYYVRWMNRWFEQHAGAEFLLKQFQLDIDRASWVVETALEWRRDQKTEIPAPLLEGISRNLFVQHDQSIEKSSAADDLASALVGNASEVKLKLGGNEVSLDRKGLVGLTKTDTSNAR